MENSNPEHRHSIGKFLRKKKNLKKKDASFMGEDISPKLQEYLDFLMSKGAKMNNISIGRFKIKNGLEYPGVYAKEEIDSDQILMEIPQELLLTTRHAWFSDLKPIFKENPDYFSPYRTSSWEDHMLLAFLVYEHGKGPDSEWYHLLENLPREIDYVIFWPEEELEWLEDESLVRLARGTRSAFEEEAKDLLNVAAKYPDLMKPDVFTYENIKWIYIHLTTRCFGKYFEYVTMVPMAELFNHECTDVFYDFRYNDENPDKPKDQDFPEPKKLTQEEVDGFETSDGSYDSVEHDQDSDFEYDDGESVLANTKKNNLKEDDSLFLGEVKTKIQDIRTYFLTKYNWGDTLAVFYIKEIMNYLEDLEKKYDKAKISLGMLRKEFAEIETSNVLFLGEMWKYCKDVLDKSTNEMKLEQFETVKRDVKKEEKYPAVEFDEDKDWKKDKMDSFVMKASWKDQFEKESQVFFCYGRLSNRLMLMRYGMALEYNKYDLVHFKLPYFKYINSNIWLVEKIKQYKMAKIKKFKSKRRKFNIDLLTFYKGTEWRYKKHSVEELMHPKNSDFEIIGLEMMIELYNKFLQKCKHSEEELKEQLRDPNLGYHQYFAVVLNLERQRLIRFHLKASLVLVEINKRLKNGLTFDFALLRVHDLETEEEYHRNRFFFAAYTERMRKFYN